MSSPPPPRRARRELGLMRPDGASFIGSASGIHFVQTVYNAVSKTGLPQQVLPGEDDQLPYNQPEVTIWRFDELTSAGNDSIQLQYLLDWSQSYFDNWHPAFPFLHAPSVVEWLSELCNSGLPTSIHQRNPIRLAIIRSVLSISLADSRQSRQYMQIPPALVFQSYEEAIQSIQPVLTNRPTIEFLQAAMSIEMFLISMLRLNGASRIHGIVVRLLYQMGLHRCPKRYSTFKTEEIEIRQRIFWSAYVIDRYLSQCLGLPITLRDDDCDVCFLDSEHHGSDADQGLVKIDHRLAFGCFIAKHARLKGQVIELCNKSISHRQFDTNSFQELNTKITKWTNELEGYEECYPLQTPVLSHTQRSILNMLKHEISLSLYRPHLTAPKSSSEYIAALQICIRESRALILELYPTIFRAPSGSITPQPSEGGTSDLVSWPFLTWSVWMSSFLILFATVEKEVSQISAVKLSDMSIEILKHLSVRGCVWPNACEAAIRDLFERFRKDHRQSSEPLTATATNPATASTEDPVGAGEIEKRAEALYSSISTQILQHSMDSQPTSTVMPGNFDTNIYEATTFPPTTGLDQIDSTLFEGFDIPFWLDDDQYAALADTWNAT